MNPDKIHSAVRDRYAAIARTATSEQASCCTPSAGAECCNNTLYDAEMVESLPVDVTNLSLGCGDPVTIASLQPGETVLDLGSGGGIDCFLAAYRVGAGGHVIGVDMTPEMLAKARSNAEKLHMDTSHVEFRQGYIEELPVDDDSVDVVMSNCVINLSPDKPAVFREAFRVLKPGGRISVSDIVTLGEMDSFLRSSMDSWAACVSGAIDIKVYTGLMRQAGFADIQVVDKVNAAPIVGLMPGMPRILSALITARKPEIGEEVVDTATGSRDYFDQVATQWDDMRSEFFSEDVREAALKRAGVQAGQTAADIGAGTGFITAGLVREGLSVIAVDQSDKMLEEMARKFTGTDAIEYRQGDADALPIQDGTLDHAFANMYLHHVESPADAIKEMARTLKPGGMLVITDLDSHHFTFLAEEQHDRWMGFNREDVARWLDEAGLHEVAVNSVGSSCCAESTCGCGKANISIWIASGRKA